MLFDHDDERRQIAGIPIGHRKSGKSKRLVLDSRFAPKVNARGRLLHARDQPHL